VLLDPSLVIELLGEVAARTARRMGSVVCFAV
jgi:hypothetical protein